MNVHTEEEAKKKVCCSPFLSDAGASTCIASECMAWRWESFLSRDNPTRAPGAGQSFDMTRGYCGLAGRP